MAPRVETAAPTNGSTLIAPYGGRLVDWVVPPEGVADLAARAVHLPAVQLSERALCDLELLAVGAFSPLDAFMGRADYERVVGEMRLASGRLFPVPVTLSVRRGAGLTLDEDVALRDARNNLVAVMRVEEIYAWDRGEACHRVLGTADVRHPLVAEMQRWGEWNVSGRLQVIALPRRHDFQALRSSPAETRRRIAALGSSRVVALEPCGPMSRALEEATGRAARDIRGTLLVHPAVGLTRPGDADCVARMRTYEAFVERMRDPGRALLAALPLAPRLAGPREAIWHAIIRRNYGASHVIIGRDHASPGCDSAGKAFYPPDAARALAELYRHEHGVEVVRIVEPVQALGERRHERDAGAPRPRGACVWLTGLPGAGKSTTAEILTVLVTERGQHVTLLDGDVVRTHFSQGLGFGKEDRDVNVRRIGFVASEIARSGGIAVCAAVSPYRAARNEVRHMFEADRFIEVLVDAPADLCERRDAKGLYLLARRGVLGRFTGIDDPYERPVRPEIVLDAQSSTPEQNARRILDFLAERGFVP